MLLDCVCRVRRLCRTWMLDGRPHLVNVVIGQQSVQRRAVYRASPAKYSNTSSASGPCGLPAATRSVTFSKPCSRAVFIASCDCRYTYRPGSLVPLGGRRIDHEKQMHTRGRVLAP